MNDKKKITINGVLLFPLHIGDRATIKSGDEVIRTSEVVSIEENNHFRAIFETVNSNYNVVIQKEPACGVLKFFQRLHKEPSSHIQSLAA